MHYFGKRYYDAGVGRWIILDPVDQYFSPYVYCGNNPLRIVDRDGQFGAVIIGLAIAYGTVLANSPDTQWDMMDIASTFTDKSATTLDKVGSVVGALVPILGSVETKGGLRVVSEVGQKISKFFNRGDDALSTGQTHKRIAGESLENVGKGSGHVHGTNVHKTFENAVNKLGDTNLHTEVSYKGGDVVKTGTKGSVKIDVVEDARNAPTSAYDLKTGKAKLAQKRTDQLRQHLPETVKKIEEIKPE